MKGLLGLRTLFWPLAALLLAGRGRRLCPAGSSAGRGPGCPCGLFIAPTRDRDPRTERRRGPGNRPGPEAGHRHPRHGTRAVDAGPGDERPFPGGKGRLHAPGKSSRHDHVLGFCIRRRRGQRRRLASEWREHPGRPQPFGSCNERRPHRAAQHRRRRPGGPGELAVLSPPARRCSTGTRADGRRPPSSRPSTRAQIAQVTYDATLKNVIYQVKQAYYTLLGDQNTVLVRQASVNQAEQNLSYYEGLLAAGRATQLDVLQSQVALTQAQLDLGQRTRTRSTSTARIFPRRSGGRWTSSTPRRTPRCRMFRRCSWTRR